MMSLFQPKICRNSFIKIIFEKYSTIRYIKSMFWGYVLLQGRVKGHTFAYAPRKVKNLKDSSRLVSPLNYSHGKSPCPEESCIANSPPLRQSKVVHPHLIQVETLGVTLNRPIQGTRKGYLEIKPKHYLHADRIDDTACD